jgi:hypothetical protein
MRRREEERKAKEAEAKKKEETARRLRELREREARERERREREAREREMKEKLRQEQEAKEKERIEREVREKIEKELREKAEREAKEREAREREAREREAKLQEEARKREEERARAERERQAARERERKEYEERAARLRKEQEEKEKAQTERKSTTYAFSSVGEKTSMWPNGKPPSVAPSQAASTPPPPKPAPFQSPPSPTKPPPSPTKPAPSPTKSTTSATGTEDTYSYRPYDKPKKPTARKKSVSDFSESSWAPSASTARTTPPPSTRGPYTTNDPQKIIIKAVYGYLNQFSKTPASQLVSGVGPVTDGLILRVTSAGLFVDDDVRGVAQREWDVKAWTLKLVEVWCPVHAVTAAAGNTPGSVPTNLPFFKTMPQSARRAAERGATKTMLGEEAVAYIDELGRVCGGACRRGNTAAGSAAGGGSSSNSEEGKGRGLHLLRATIRDQEGKRFLFVISEEEAWKIAGGLAALRGSSQVRALGVAGFSSMEAKTLLDTLGWGG